MLKLSDLIMLAGDKEVAYVYSAPVHYILLPNKDFKLTSKSLDKFNDVLDQIEANCDNRPGVVVTVGTGGKHFSTGFDLKFWCEKFEQMRESYYKLQHLLGRLLSFKLPTMCVMNGSALAGGYFLALAHDVRIMDQRQGEICLTELKVGISMPQPLIAILKAKLQPQQVTRLGLGATYSYWEALQNGLIDGTYKDAHNMESQISSFAKFHAFAGLNQEALLMNRESQLGDTIRICQTWQWGVKEQEIRYKNWLNLRIMMSKLQKKLRVKSTDRQRNPANLAPAKREKPMPKL